MAPARETVGKSVWWVLVLGALVVAVSCSHLRDSSERSPSSISDPAITQISDVRGLPGIDFSRWSDKLYNGSGRLISPLLGEGELKKKILSGFQSSRDFSEFYDGILAIQDSWNSTNPKSYDELAHALYSARHAIALEQGSIHLRRPARELLEVLAEETLYAMVIKFPSKFESLKSISSGKMRSQWRTDFSSGSTSENAAGRLSKLSGFTIVQGDVILSKGSTGASSFLVRSTDDPGNFSQSGVAYIEPGRTVSENKLSLIEASIEDGVKLRDPTNDLSEARKRKVFVYRYAPSKGRGNQHEKLPMVINSVDQLVSEMKTTVQDPWSQSAFPYDFEMNPADHQAMFASEVVLDAYSKDPGADSINPYPRKSWSTISGATEDFFRKYFNFKHSSYPAPSDIDYDQDYQLVGMTVDVSELQEDRIDGAVADTLIALMQEKQDQFAQILDRLSTIGNSDTSTDTLEKLVVKGLLSRAKAQEIRSKIPEGANLKQLVFFGFLDSVLFPQIRATMERADNTSIYGSPKRPMSLHKIRNGVAQTVNQKLDQLQKALKEALP